MTKDDPIVFTLWVAGMADVEYNDEYHYIEGEGFNPQVAFRSRAEAAHWCRDQNINGIKSGEYWAREDSIEDDQTQKRWNWYFTVHAPNPELTNPRHYINWQNIYGIEFPHDVFIEWCENNDKDVRDYYMSPYRYASVTLL